MKLAQSQLIDLLKDFHPKLDHKGKNLIIDCPYCGHRECGISIEEGHRFGCYRKKMCGQTGNIFTILRHIGKTIGYSAIGLSELDRLDIPSLGSQDSEESLNIQIELPSINPPVGWTRVWDDPYLRSRNFFEYAKHPVGRTMQDRRVQKDYVIFLIYHKDQVVGWLGRHEKSKEWIEHQNQLWFKKAGIKNKVKRYFNSPGVDFGKILYGVEECTSKTTTLLLVEGLFDKVSVDRKMDLDSNEDVKCCCTFKCAISDEQLFQIIQLPSVDTIVLLYDPDVIKEIRAAASKLEAYGYNVLIAFSKTGKDPDEMNDEEFAQTLDEATPSTAFSLDFVDQGLL